MEHARPRRVVRDLPPGSFAFVMATGIVSTAFELRGWHLLSVILLGIAVAGGVALAAGTLWRLVSYRTELLRDADDPARSFGFFTVVAGINVIGIRLHQEAPVATIALAVLSVPIWLVLTYGLPAGLMLRRHAVPVSSQADGSWFLWVVGTQSLATAAATIAMGDASGVLAELAVALWGVGVMLYLMLTTVVTLRLLTSSADPRSLSPSYWIYMGATAITVLAGSRILVLPQDLPIFAATAAVISGLTYLLWAFGVWWIPLLIVFGVWRHAVHREALRYESGLWSIVFPLGMYSVASMHYGAEVRLPAMVLIGQAGAWVAGLAWLGAAVAMVVAWAGSSRRAASSLEA